jgi:hypothetical protein
VLHNACHVGWNEGSWESPCGLIPSRSTLLSAFIAATLMQRFENGMTDARAEMKTAEVGQRAPART